jgi:hypothetical protein
LERKQHTRTRIDLRAVFIGFLQMDKCSRVQTTGIHTTWEIIREFSNVSEKDKNYANTLRRAFSAVNIGWLEDDDIILISEQA